MNIQLNGRKNRVREMTAARFTICSHPTVWKIVLSLLKETGRLSEKTNIKQSNWKNTMSSKSFILSEGDKPLC